MTATKKCSRCGLEKPLEEFVRDMTRRDGRRGWCRACKNEYGVNHYANEARTVGPFKCQECGREFNLKKSEASRRRTMGKFPPKYCSQECYKSARRTASQSVMGPFTCQRCGEVFYISNSSVKSKISSSGFVPKFCSRVCYQASRGEGATRRKRLCKILSAHHNALKDDPERLSTDFLISLIGGAASNCEGSE